MLCQKPSSPKLASPVSALSAVSNGLRRDFSITWYCFGRLDCAATDKARPGRLDPAGAVWSRFACCRE